MLQAFAYWEKTPDCEYRWGTLLVSNGDERIVGNAVLKNPGSARPLEAISSRPDGRLKFTVDLTMVCLAELFGIKKTGGAIRIFNLSCIREADYSKAKHHFRNLNDKDEDVAREILAGPAVQTYIGWGDLYKEPMFLGKAEAIFKAAKIHTPSLEPQIDDNLFIHPLYLMHYGRKKEECKKIVAKFRSGSPHIKPTELFLISTFQCAKLLTVDTDHVRRLLRKRKLDYVRDSERIFRISLDSVMEYAQCQSIAIDNEYLDSLKKRIHPWREVKSEKGVDIVAPTQSRPQETVADGLSAELLKMGFCPRALNAFRKNGITTAEQLTSLKATDLMKFHYFGRKTLNHVRTVLSENGLSLKNSRSQ